jgi:hypothetical protein
MTTLRAALAAAALAVLLGGCSDSPDPADGAAPAASYDPAAELRDTLRAAADVLQAGDYTFVVASPTGTAEGFVHLPSESARITTDSGGKTFELVLAEPNRWVRLSTGGSWFQVDSSQVRDGSDLALELTDPDLVGLDALFAAVTEVGGDPKTITGTIDGTRAKSAFFAESGTALAFTANLDGKGRLAELDIDAPDGRWVITVSGYGEQKPQTKPAGRIRDLPSSDYAMPPHSWFR